MNILRTVTLDRANRKKDGSVSLTFITQLEQSSDEFMEIDKLLNDGGVIHFKTSGALTSQEIKALQNTNIETEGKTQSQKIRNKIWVLGNKQGFDADAFYKLKTEKILDYLQKELDKLD